MGFITKVGQDIFGGAMDAISGLTGAKQAGKAAQKAATTQAAAAEAGIAEQRRQFDTLVSLMAPYVAAGTGPQGALPAQQALLGLRGAGAQERAIAGIEQSPIFQALARQGEEAILQQASATGGLRGGNVQAALAQFRPQMLNQLIEQQYERLGGLSKLGQAAAAGQAEQGMAVGTNIANLLANRGQALAGGQLAAGNVRRQTFGDILSLGETGAKFAGMF